MTSNQVQPPPKLLLGAAVLFWGAMSGYSPLALILALVIESPNWIRSRWNFNDQTCVRAWQLSLIITVFTAIPIWLDGNRYTAFPRLLTWLPVLLIPLQFIQLFGFVNYLNLSNFYFFSRIQRKRNEELGIEQANIRFNFGNIYFIAILIAATLSPHAQQKAFYIGLTILVAWRILAHVRHRIFAMVTLLVMAGAIGLGGQIGMSILYKWASNYGHDHGEIPSAHPTLKHTSIGSLGPIKQSPEMLWRITTSSGQSPPRLLRTCTYNRYRGVTWRTNYPRDLFEDDELEFRELGSIDLTLTSDLTIDDSFYLLRENMNRGEITKPLPKFEIRGAAIPGEPLPLPGNAATLQKFIHEGIEINPLGTVCIYPQKPVIQGTARWNDDLTNEVPPFTNEDLAIDEYEMEGIHEVAEALGLKELATTTEKVQRLRKFFDTEFEYTRYLTIDQARPTKTRPSPIETFLTTNKSGHCEYFATAATLLLRAADVPARYSIGFAVMEKNESNDEWVIRGTHAHAWTRVWNEELQTWVDFDPTPAGWMSVEAHGKSRYQTFLDFYQRIKEDFFLWRNDPGNRLGVTIAAWTLGALLLVYIAIRLNKSRVVVGSKKSSTFRGQPTLKTPLHHLEKAALKILGPRAQGETWINWLKKLKAHQVNGTDLDEACELHQQLRFDPTPPDQQLQQELSEITRKLLTQLKRS